MTDSQTIGPVDVVVVSERNPVPEGGDGSSLLQLAFQRPGGQRIPIDGEARAYVAFRDGVALVDREHALVLVSPDGSRRTLARVSGAPPARAPDGGLVYVVTADTWAEVHWLSESGRDRVVAGGIASAGVLAPQVDGRLFFVAARSGGVAGLWVAPVQGPARCLTNCELGRAPWGDAFVPLPASAGAIQADQASVRFTASDNSQRVVALQEEAGAGDDGRPTPTTDGNALPVGTTATGAGDSVGDTVGGRP